MKAMAYELTGTQEISEKAAKKLRSTDINKMTTGAIVWHLVTKHKFALLATFTIVYVMFSLFGMLIVGLFQSLVG
jgi:hypothetical protein